MEEVNNDNLIKDEKNKVDNIITNKMSTHLIKKPKNEDLLFKSERPNNDDDIESIETKLSEIQLTKEVFTRENFISNREFKLPEKKVTNELVILSQDKIDREKKQQEYQQELKTEMEAHKKNMEKDEEKIKRYYKRRQTNDKASNIILAIILVIIIILILVLIYILS